MARTTIAAAIVAISGAAFAQHGTDKPMAADTTPTLVGPEWIVEDIAGEGVIDDAQASLMFHEDGSLSGSGSCNRLRGQYTEEDGTLSFTPIATTMMLCPEPIMDQEAQLLSMLETVERWEVDESGALALTTREGMVIRARTADGEAGAEAPG